MGEHPFFIIITYEEFIFFMILVTIFLCVVASISAYREKKRKRPGFYNFTDNDSFDMMEE